jgi:hypothetical protein
VWVGCFFVCVWFVWCVGGFWCVLCVCGVCVCVVCMCVCVFAGNIDNIRFIISIFLFTFQDEMNAAVQKCQKLNGITNGKFCSPHDRLKGTETSKNGYIDVLNNFHYVFLFQFKVSCNPNQ